MEKKLKKNLIIGIAALLCFATSLGTLWEIWQAAKEKPTVITHTPTPTAEETKKEINQELIESPAASPQITLSVPASPSPRASIRPRREIEDNAEIED